MTTAKGSPRKTAKPKPSGTPVAEALDAPLSPHWAFVVQFRAAPGGPVSDAGRIEHLVSGRITRFQSLEELTAYLAKELQAGGKK